jgi:bisphosphoglycerate-independent phosphoglycerate mutase (AlkP superfamily)
MNKDKSHNMASLKDRELPLFLILAEESGKGDAEEVISQLQIAPTICKLLDIPIPETMKSPPFI